MRLKALSHVHFPSRFAQRVKQILIHESQNSTTGRDGGGLQDQSPTIEVTPDSGARRLKVKVRFAADKSLPQGGFDPAHKDRMKRLLARAAPKIKLALASKIKR